MPRKKDPVRYFKIVPTSCRCGGNLAWIEVEQSGTETMIGCICHYTPHFLTNVPLRREATPATVSHNSRRKPITRSQTATSNPTEKEIQ